MSNYIPSDGTLKRERVLRNREIELAKAVAAAAAGDKIESAAEGVRQARLNLIRTKLIWALYACHIRREDSRILNLEKDRLEWETLTCEEIIERLPVSPPSKDPAVGENP